MRSYSILMPALWGWILSGALVFGKDISLNEHLFSLPDGFEIQHVAGPPLVDRPMIADFDEAGNLYVADSAGININVHEQLKTKPHRVVRLTDTDGDGRFDSQTVFADQMMFPEGALWHRGSLYVAAPPSIWKLTDTDGDGVADEREEWFEGKTLTGCANDLHGPYLGRDGLIYWCKGAFAEQTYPRPGKPDFKTRAAHIFRRNPDGGTVEPVMTGGMDNPIEVVFSPEGDRFFTTTFFQHPSGGRRDGLIHAIHGGVYGKVHDVIEDHPRTGEVMPVLTHLGPAAPCGLMQYESTAMGGELQGNLFACLFNLRKVTRHELIPNGSTFTTRDSDFLVSDNRDFHPTDVLEDADGSILVLDTGGWYKICCPTSQLSKPDVYGGIYRITKSASKPADDPRGTSIIWKDKSAAELLELLGDERPSVRRQALDRLVHFGDEAVAAIAETIPRDASLIRRQNAIWALGRIDSDKIAAPLRGALFDKNLKALQTAVHVAGLLRERSVQDRLIKILRLSSGGLKRETAAALGRIGGRQSAAALFEAAAETHDRALDHAIVYGLMECGDREFLEKEIRLAARRLNSGALTNKGANQARALLIAMDQMEGSALSADLALPFLKHSHDRLRQSALWIVGQHPEWGGSMIDYFNAALTESNLNDNQDTVLDELLETFESHPEVRRFLQRKLASGSLSEPAALAVLRQLNRTRDGELDASWKDALWTLIQSSQASLRASALLALAKAPFESIKFSTEESKRLNALAEDADAETLERLRAIRLLSVADSMSFPDSLFPTVLEALPSDRTAAERQLALRILQTIQLTDERASRLAGMLPRTSPMELPKLIALYSERKNDRIGASLIQGLEEHPSAHIIPPNDIERLFAPLENAIQDRARKLLAKWDVDPQEKKRRLESLLTQMQGGDVRRGQAVFNSPKAACSTCHEIGYLGGNLGPDLTRIGQIRSEMDLLEAILYPNASFVRSYEPYIVSTKDDEEYSGILKSETPDGVVLLTGPDNEVRLDKEQVAEIRPDSVSIMPGGLDQLLTQQELADLMAFLKATRW